MRGQTQAVLNELKEGREVTNKRMFEIYGVTRLSSIIYELRNHGFIIHTIMTDGKTRFGDSTKYARYILGKEGEEE